MFSYFKKLVRPLRGYSVLRPCGTNPETIFPSNLPPAGLAMLRRLWRRRNGRAIC